MSRLGIARIYLTVILIHKSRNCIPKLSKAVITVFSDIVPVFLHCLVSQFELLSISYIHLCTPASSMI